MPAPAIPVVLDSIHATRSLALSTTVQTIAVPRAIWGLCSELLLTIDDASASAGGYQILADGGNAISDVAPTTDFYPLYGRVGQPIPCSVHNPAEATGGTVHIMVWAASGTPLLSIQPMGRR